MPLDIALDPTRLADLCRRYHVATLELVGSRAQGTARLESDVDLLVTFEPETVIGLEFYALGMDLEALLGRHVDLLTRPRVERDHNARFRTSVLNAVALLSSACRGRGDSADRLVAGDDHVEVMVAGMRLNQSMHHVCSRIEVF